MLGFAIVTTASDPGPYPIRYYSPLTETVYSLKSVLSRKSLFLDVTLDNMQIDGYLMFNNTCYDHKDIDKYSQHGTNVMDRSIIDYTLVERHNTHEILEVRPEARTRNIQ